MNRELNDVELVAKFHGWKHIPTPKGTGNGYWSFPEWSMSHWTSNSFLYDRSWDWLMEVVKKINKLYDEAFPPHEEFVRRILAKEEPFDIHYTNVIALPLSTPINEAFKAIVDFIKWYNQQEQC